MNDKITKILAILLDADPSDKLYLDKYTPEEIMMHCAEEMSEASAAILKLVRIRENGPTAKIDESGAYEHAMEELADSLSLGYLLARKLNCEEDLALRHLNKSVDFQKISTK